MDRAPPGARRPAHTNTVQNIAAFASLHVAIATTACLVAQRAGLHRAFVWALRAFLVITMVATVYFGWHYVSDVIAGLLLGFVGRVGGEKFAAPDQVPEVGGLRAQCGGPCRSQCEAVTRPARTSWAAWAA